MTSYTLVKVTLLVLVAVIHQGTALRCWVCSSNTSPECDDPINLSDHHKRFHIRDCESTYTQNLYPTDTSVCRKTVQIENGNRVVVRACAVPTPEERENVDGVCSAAASRSNIHVKSCHICSSELCNGAYSTLGQMSVIKSLLFFCIPSILFAYRWSF